MKRKVEFVYIKEVRFEAKVEQEELDNIAINGIVPDWIDEKANEIDNEQPLEFLRFKRIKNDNI